MPERLTRKKVVYKLAEGLAKSSQLIEQHAPGMEISAAINRNDDIARRLLTRKMQIPVRTRRAIESLRRKDPAAAARVGGYVTAATSWAPRWW